MSYTAYTNHIEILDRAIELADGAGFSEATVSAGELRARLECGVYEEDYAMMPGAVGEHFPAPWTQGPDYPFNHLLPVTKIPYGLLTDPWSGWYRGFSHGYDPVSGHKWPNAQGTTIEWANSPDNTFSWSNAVALYARGERAEAYECLGHVLHLLMDLSVPAHVRVVNHGAVLSKRNSGYQWDPDLVSITIDEYEMALNGGLENNLISLIPDLHGTFLNALAIAQCSNIPKNLNTWSDYLRGIALLAAGNTDVNRYYHPPDAQGVFGHYLDRNGGIVYPVQLGSIIGPGLIGDRYTQVAIYSTATASGGTVIPHQALEAMCDSLVPKAAEYSAGLLVRFWKTVTTAVHPSGGAPEAISMLHNYPNPFNPSTNIEFLTPASAVVTLVVCDLLGRQVRTLLNGTVRAGRHSVQWDGRDSRGTPVGSGMYAYRLTVGSNHAETKTMIMMR